MKKLMGILFVMIAAAAGCATETAGSDEADRITCAPSEASCASDPRMPAARATALAMGLDLDRDVALLTLTNATSDEEALGLAPDDDVDTVARSSCDVGPLNGICCWNTPTGDIDCVVW